jgi:iron(II)-dependent oxidoreductase
MRDARSSTLELLGGVTDADLHAVHTTLLSPLVWDLGHIAAFEDLWLVHRWGGQDMLREDMGDVYDAFETPRAKRGDLEFLERDEAEEYLAQVRERVEALTSERGAGDSLIHELVLQHELQHNETMLQALEIAHLEDFVAPPRAPLPAAGATHSGLELLDVPVGGFEMGAPASRFAYDNERPRRYVEVAPFRIGRTTVTNATWLEFAEGGGYERREWWTGEAWSWKQEYDITHPGGWTGDGREWRADGLVPIDPHAPVVHVSWFEADAFARAHGARLPTEAEWEKAATWDQNTGETLPAPWGNGPAGATLANLGQRGFAPAPAGAYPDGAAPCGALGMLGDVWEWTSTPFDGYPGFRAHPYKEYSEVFFGPGHRVLRGGSWATAARVATATFRNWDFPQRRQIFSGVRIAQDA